MTHHPELFLSTNDAAALHVLVGQRRHAQGPESEAVQALQDLLEEAELLPQERMPADRVTMNSQVTYVEDPGGAHRTVTLVHPADADPAAGRISVLSPVGRALLGRAPGAQVAVPGLGRAKLRIRVLSLDRGGAA